MQLTDRHIYFTWEDERRRQDIPLIQDAENAQELAPPIIQDVIGEFEEPLGVLRTLLHKIIAITR